MSATVWNCSIEKPGLGLGKQDAAKAEGIVKMLAAKRRKLGNRMTILCAGENF
jgi:hypothetical protein